MYTNEQPNDDPSLNRGSANKMNTNPAAGPPGAASQPGEPGAAAPLHAMSTPIQPYGADTVIYEKSDNFVQTSAGADVFMPPVNDTFSVPEGGATAVASLTVDDWGKLTISGPGGTFELDLTSAVDEPGKLGGHQEWTKSGSFELSEGTYTLSVTHQNIDMPHNEYNQSVCRYSVTVTAHGDSSSSSSSSDTPPSSLSSSSSSDVPPEEKEICCRCGTCTDAEGNEYTIAAEKLPGDPGVEICMSQAEFLARGGASAPSPAAFSLRSAENARETAEACGGLKYVSPWAWRVHLDETSGLITVVPPVGAALYFNVQAGSDTALPAGISRKRDFRVQLLDETLAPASSGAPAYLSLVDADGQKIRFSAETGAVVAMTSASGKVLLAEDYFRNVNNTYDPAGNLVSSYSAAEGLMRTRTGADGELVLEWYAPAAVTVLADGTYEVTGEPYKTSSFLSSEENGVRTTVITRQQRGLPAHTITRTEEPGRVSIAKGQGDDIIIRTIETNRLYGGLSERIETVRGINDAEPVACNRSVRQYTDGGWLLVSETEAFNTPLARTTSYEYNSQYRVSRINRPDGGYTRYEYDGEGRVTLEAAPWAGGGEQVTRTEYAGLRFYDNRPARVAEFRVLSDGTEIELTAAAYAYERSPLMERVTKTVTAAGSGQEQTSVEETYGEAAAYPYAAGQTKFTRDIAGVETFYDYEAAVEHGAAHKKTAVTKVGGELAAGQSRKTESFLAANDTVLVEQESIWDGENWLLLSSGAHEYDEEGRRTKTTRGNGRVSATSWMCCGKLSETDEDGILTSYGYNSAHQLVETIRSEISDGDTVITPETITTYTRDAAGRALQTRRDRGAMTTTESVEYDRLGRIVRQTDVLGRVTATAYSENGLTETVTTPSGATLVTERHPDGSVLHEYGTGQRERYHVYDIGDNCLRETVTLADQTTLLSRTLVNGFGQSVLQVTPTTAGFLYDHSEYNAQGRLIRTWRDAGTQEGAVAMAPTLYEYDAFGNMTRETLALAEQPAVQAVYAPLHDLEEQSVSGDLLTNIFAGGTVDSEWGFLTGYTQHEDFRKPTDSYVWYFREQGYHTLFHHPGYSWFYNRQNVNEYLGFEESWFTENYYGALVDPVDAVMRSDETLVDGILDGLREPGPWFSFSVSYQNHGPYETASAQEVFLSPGDTGWSAETCNMLNNYMSNVSSTLAAMERLTRELNARPEPFVLVLFGDHKPWMGNGNTGYTEIGAGFDLSQLSGFREYYSTPYLIWANSAAREALGNSFTGEGGDFSPCFLMNKVFELCGWEGPGFMELSRQLEAISPLIHTRGLFLSGGILTDALVPEEARFYQQFLQAQYYRETVVIPGEISS